MLPPVRHALHARPAAGEKKKREREGPSLAPRVRTRHRFMENREASSDPPGFGRRHSVALFVLTEPAIYQFSNSIQRMVSVGSDIRVEVAGYGGRSLEWVDRRLRFVALVLRLCSTPTLSI